jgi:hypothetical protein
MIFRLQIVLEVFTVDKVNTDVAQCEFFYPLCSSSLFWWDLLLCPRHNKVSDWIDWIGWIDEDRVQGKRYLERYSRGLR